MNPKELERYYLGEVQLVEEPDSGETLMALASTHSARGEVEALAARLHQRQKLKHASLVELRSIETDAQSSWCSTVYRLRSAYEYFPNNLRKEMLMRRRKGLCFNGVELLRLIYDAVDVLAYLQANDIKHGDLTPTLMFLRPDHFEGVLRLKLCERLSGSANKQTNYINALTANVDLYLAPAAFAAFASGGQGAARENPFKRDVFALGLCVLEAGLLESVQVVYNKLKGAFLHEKLAELRGSFAGLFSGLPALPFLLEQMLRPAETERPDFLQLAQGLPPWRDVVEFVRKHPNAARPEGELSRINRTLDALDQSQVGAAAPYRPSVSSMKEFETARRALKEAEQGGAAPKPFAPKSSEPPAPVRGFFDEGGYAAAFLPPDAAVRDRFKCAASLEDFTTPTPPRVDVPPNILDKNNIPRTYRSETGTVYQSVTEERMEVNDQGEPVKRIYVKYHPVEEPGEAQPPKQAFVRAPAQPDEKQTLSQFMDEGNGGEWQREAEGGVVVFH